MHYVDTDSSLAAPSLDRRAVRSRNQNENRSVDGRAGRTDRRTSDDPPYQPRLNFCRIIWSVFALWLDPENF